MSTARLYLFNVTFVAILAGVSCTTHQENTSRLADSVGCSRGQRELSPLIVDAVRVAADSVDIAATHDDWYLYRAEIDNGKETVRVAINTMNSGHPFYVTVARVLVLGAKEGIIEPSLIFKRYAGNPRALAYLLIVWNDAGPHQREACLVEARRALEGSPEEIVQGAALTVLAETRNPQDLVVIRSFTSSSNVMIAAVARYAENRALKLLSKKEAR